VDPRPTSNVNWLRAEKAEKRNFPLKEQREPGRKIPEPHRNGGVEMSFREPIGHPYMAPFTEKAPPFFFLRTLRKQWRSSGFLDFVLFLFSFVFLWDWGKPPPNIHNQSCRFPTRFTFTQPLFWGLGLRLKDEKGPNLDKPSRESRQVRICKGRTLRGVVDP